MGIALAMVAMLTLLPGAAGDLRPRARSGRAIPHVGDDGHRRDARRLAARRRARRRAARARLDRHAALLAARHARAGVLNSRHRPDQANSFRGTVESVEGQELLAQAFPAGATAPTDVIVPDRAKAPAVRARPLRRVDGVAAGAARRPARPAPASLLDARAAARPVLDGGARPRRPDPRGGAQAAGGPSVLVGGPTRGRARPARRRGARHRSSIIPLVLLVVLLDPRRAAARARRAAAAHRDGDRAVLRGGARRRRPSSSTSSSASRAATRRCRCSPSCSSSRWASTTTSS